MADIFVSYSREDQERILPFIKALEDKGWSVFWDRRIPAGSTWRGYIGKSLEEAGCVIVAWSRYSIASTWVAEEADDAQNRGVLIPVLLDPVLPPIGFRSIQATSLADWKPGKPSLDFDHLIKDIAAVLQSNGAENPEGRPKKDLAQDLYQKELSTSTSPPSGPALTKPGRVIVWVLAVAAVLLLGYIGLRKSSWIKGAEEEPVLAGLVFASKIEANGQAVDPSTTFPADISDLYAVFRPGMAPPGMALNVANPEEGAYYAYLRVMDASTITRFGWRWLYNGRQLNEYQTEVKQGEGIWLQYWDYGDSGIFSGTYPPGTYTIVILIDGNPAMSSKLIIEPTH